jgi:hypothetical protein
VKVRVRLAALALLFGARGLPAADEPIGRDVPGAVDLTGAPRAAALDDARIVVASPVAGGVDVVVLPAGTPVAAVRRDDLMVGGRRGPRIAVAGGTIVLAAITRRTKEGGGDLLTWTSKDAGATWASPVSVGDVPGCAAEGLFDLAALGDGRFVVVWLDVRKKGTRLAADFSADGAKWGDDVVAYESPSGSICECCHPAVAATRDGRAFVAFRNSLDGARDVYTVGLERGATTFGPARKCGRGSWKLDACPMAGPAVDERRCEPIAAWRRGGNVWFAQGGEPERDLGEGTEPAIVYGDWLSVLVYYTRKDELILASAVRGPLGTVARDASMPSAVAGGTGVVWLDVAKKRARLLR